MKSRLFGQFLLERGLITKDMLLDAMTYQKDIHAPLFALAVEHDYLTRDQLKLLDQANVKSDRPFLEIALKERMLTLSQVDALRRIQSEKWVFFGEALVERGHLTPARLHELFEAYRKERTAGEDMKDVSMESVQEQTLVSSLLKVTIDIFIHYTRQIVQVESVTQTDVPPDDAAYVFSQRIFGDKNFDYLLALPEPLTLRIASHLLQQEATQVDQLVLDAVSEFVNIVVGNGCAKLSMSNWKVKAEPPQVLPRQMLSGLIKPGSVVVKMKTTKGSFSLVFSFAEAKGA